MRRTPPRGALCQVLRVISRVWTTACNPLSSAKNLLELNPNAQAETHVESVTRAETNVHANLAIMVTLHLGAIQIVIANLA